MQKDQQKLIELIKGKKVAFIGAGVSHKTLIKEFVELGAHVTLEAIQIVFAQAQVDAQLLDGCSVIAQSPPRSFSGRTGSHGPPAPQTP